MINTVFLKTYATLAEQKSFVGTARLLNMTQPGVSQHLKNLEDYYGTILIERKAKTFYLTEAGEKLRSFCTQLFMEHDLLKQSLSIDDPEVGEISIASPGSYGLFLYSKLLQHNQKFPHWVVNFTVSPNSSILRDIEADKIILGFVSKKVDIPHLTFEMVAEEELCLVIPAKAKVNRFEDLINLGLINHPDCAYYIERILKTNFGRQFESLNAIPQRGYINQLSRILDPVAKGLGFTALPKFAVDAYSQPKYVKTMNLKHKQIDKIFAVWKEGRILPQRYRKVLSLLYNP